MQSAIIELLVGFLVAASPTIIVGLTRYPRALGVLRLVWLFLQRLSVVVHSDSPGTFKPPGTLSPAPPSSSSSSAGGPS